MAILRFLHTPAGRTLRILSGLLLLAYGALTPTLLGILALMAGIAGIVTGLARLPHPPGSPRAPEAPR